MNTRPRSITVIGWVFIAVGSLGIVKDLLPVASRQASQDIDTHADLLRRGTARAAPMLCQEVNPVRT